MNRQGTAAAAAAMELLFVAPFVQLLIHTASQHRVCVCTRWRDERTFVPFSRTPGSITRGYYAAAVVASRICLGKISAAPAKDTIYMVYGERDQQQKANRVSSLKTLKISRKF